jgi:hypothetical protein
MKLSTMQRRRGRRLNEKGFRAFVAKINSSREMIGANVGLVKEFEAFVKRKGKRKDLDNFTVNDLHDFVKYLMKNGKNTRENAIALLRYARFSRNREAEIAILELADGSDVLNNLSDVVMQAVGEKKHKEVFQGIELPPLGMNPKDKPKVTKKVMEKLEAKLDEKTCKQVLSSNLHFVPNEAFLEDKKRFQECKSIDNFLKKRHKEYVEELARHAKEKTLYFTQEVDEEVVDYVRNTPTCQVGVRKGDVIYVTKIPYMAKKYLHEKDERMKRYYACHCAWVREAIKTDMKISPNFCYCSAGFEKRLWDVIFDQPVKADVIQTVLKGDPICKFTIHIPKEFLVPKDATRKK